MSSSVGRMSSVRSTFPLTLSVSSSWVRTLPEIAPLVVEREILAALAALTLTAPLTEVTSSSSSVRVSSSVRSTDTAALTVSISNS